MSSGGRKYPAGEIQVCERQQREPLGSVLGDATIAHLGLAELYNKWFLRRLPTGETMNLPMSPQLDEVFRMLGQPE